MKILDASLPAKATWLRRHSLNPKIKPEKRGRMLRAAKNLDAVVKHRAKKKAGNPVPSRDQLYKIFSEASQSNYAHLKEELNHTHMVALADVLDGWAMGERREPEQSAQLMGQAEGLRRLADEVGPSWSTPEPERLSVIGFIARQFVREE